jgi:hypothetical protein
MVTLLYGTEVTERSLQISTLDISLELLCIASSVVSCIPLQPYSLSVYRSVGKDNRLLTCAKNIFGLLGIG